MPQAFPLSRLLSVNSGEPLTAFKPKLKLKNR
nr:MAG TPA: hypothetical protein [Caudoviricetes sp.]